MVETLATNDDDDDVVEDSLFEKALRHARLEYIDF
jgi:hypothetical protein